MLFFVYLLANYVVALVIACCAIVNVTASLFLIELSPFVCMIDCCCHIYTIIGQLIQDNDNDAVSLY